MQGLDLAAISGAFAHLGAEVQTPQFWVALTKIIWINVLLSGDNALVIALACRGLQPRQRLWGMVLGAGVAVMLRVIFTGIVATLMALPFLKLIGGLLLLYIAAKLLVPEAEDEDEVHAAAHLWAAVRIVAVADIIMSLDNVIAVAAAAQGSLVLMVLGLAISIPMIVAGAAAIMALLDSVPALVWLGAALLGWIAGDVIATDPAVEPVLHRLVEGQISLAIDFTSTAFNMARNLKFGESVAEFLCAAAGAILVVIVGGAWRRRRMRALDQVVV